MAEADRYIYHQLGLTSDAVTPAWPGPGLPFCSAGNSSGLERFLLWLGAGVIAAGVSAATIAGAGLAAYHARRQPRF